MNTEASYRDFEKKVAAILKKYPLLKIKQKHIELCRLLHKQGATVSEAARLISLDT